MSCYKERYFRNDALALEIKWELHFPAPSRKIRGRAGGESDVHENRLKVHNSSYCFSPHKHKNRQTLPLFSFSMHLCITQTISTTHYVVPGLGYSWRGSCYRTCLLHGCRRLVHGRRHPEEDLLPPGDPARGRGETRAHRVAAAARQRPLPAFSIAEGGERRAASQTPGEKRVRDRLTFSKYRHAHASLSTHIKMIQGT